MDLVSVDTTSLLHLILNYEQCLMSYRNLQFQRLDQEHG